MLTKLQYLAVVLSAVFTATHAIAAPATDAPIGAASKQVQTATVLNRNGAWEESLAITTGLLETELDDVTACEALLNAAHSAMMLGRLELTDNLLDRAEARRQALPKNHWVHEETARLNNAIKKRYELDAGQPASSRGERERNAAHEAPGLVWSVRLANSQADYAEAIRLAETVMRISGVASEVACDNLMHTMYAYHKLGQYENRDRVLQEFLKASHSLDPDSTLVPEMRGLLQSLNLSVPGALMPTSKPVFKPKPDGFWEIADPVALGLDTGLLRQHYEHAIASGADAFLVAYRGQIISEWYSDRYTEPMGTMSSVKSITALLAGLLLEEGKIASLDAPVSDYLPDWDRGHRSRVTLRHLLTMTAGLPRVSQGQKGVGFATNKNKHVIHLTPTTEPGLAWQYSNEGTQLLSPILEKAAGMPLHQYAKEKLFAPLGMAGTRMQVNRGQTITYADAQTTLRDFARLGLLMLNDGKHAGKQVVPADWVRSCVTPGKVYPGYGYLWWLESEPRSYSMRGYLNTSVYVFPDQDLVLARMQRKVYLHAMQDYDVRQSARWLIDAVSHQSTNDRYIK